MKRDALCSRKHPRRTFLAGLLGGLGGISALLFGPRGVRAKRAQTTRAKAPVGPILYQRTEETERYYRTLYR